KTHLLRCSGATLSCGTISDVSYPFRSVGDPNYCGHPGLVLDCQNNNIPTIDIVNITYRVLGIDQTTRMKIFREDFGRKLSTRIS
ncbi:hypothetical protein U1Q18_051335, partial [Sarracenia purpurea var. burkii]